MLVVVREVLQFLLDLLVVLLSEFERCLLKIIIGVPMIYESSEVSLNPLLQEILGD